MVVPIDGRSLPQDSLVVLIDYPAVAEELAACHLSPAQLRYVGGALYSASRWP
jgi:hypothetical protein